MSNGFKSYQVRTEAAVRERAEIIKTGEKQVPDVREFELSRHQLDPGAPDRRESTIADRRLGTAAGVPPKPEAAHGAQKDSRFVLSTLARDALSVNDEEERIIKEKVAAQIASLEKVAREQATAQGYEAGLEAGRKEANSRFQEEGQARLNRLETLIDEFETAKTMIYRQNEKFLIDLVYRIGRMVMLRELQADREYLVRLATSLIERMGLRENLRLKINPGELESLEMLRAGITERLAGLRNVKIEGSTEVGIGGCILETDWGAIDASLHTQLEELHAALTGEKARAVGGTPDPQDSPAGAALAKNIETVPGQGEAE